MNILVALGDPDFADNISTVLENEGYNLTVLNNSEQILDAYKRKVFDAVISDLKPSDNNGMELIKKIKDYDYLAKIIIFTAKGDTITALEALNNKAYSCFEKPVDYNELSSALSRIKNGASETSCCVKDYDRMKVEHAKLKELFDNIRNNTEK